MQSRADGSAQRTGYGDTQRHTIGTVGVWWVGGGAATAGACVRAVSVTRNLARNYAAKGRVECPEVVSVCIQLFSDSVQCLEFGEWEAQPGGCATTAVQTGEGMNGRTRRCDDAGKRRSPVNFRKNAFVNSLTSCKLSAQAVRALALNTTAINQPVAQL